MWRPEEQRPIPFCRVDHKTAGVHTRKKEKADDSNERSENGSEQEPK